MFFLRGLHKIYKTILFFILKYIFNDFIDVLKTKLAVKCIFFYTK